MIEQLSLFHDLMIDKKVPPLNYDALALNGDDEEAIHYLRTVLWRMEIWVILLLMGCVHATLEEDRRLSGIMGSSLGVWSSWPQDRLLVFRRWWRDVQGKKPPESP